MPGRCPSCNQTYTDETLSFCPNDGTPLVKEAGSSYDPQATMISQPPPNYPPQQGGYYPPPGGQAPPPPGGQTPPPGWQQQQQQPPPYGQQPPPPYGQQQYAPQYGAPGGGGKSKLPLIIAIAAVLLIGGGIGAYFLLRDNSSTSSREKEGCALLRSRRYQHQQLHQFVSKYDHRAHAALDDAESDSFNDDLDRRFVQRRREVQNLLRRRQVGRSGASN